MYQFLSLPFNGKKINARLLFLFLLSSAFVFLATACGGVKPQLGGKSSKYFETFYAGSDGGTQYFIKPLAFVAADKQQLSVDFTLRDLRFEQDSTTINYTLITDQQLPEDQEIVAIGANQQTLFTTERAERLFQERTKTGFLARYTARAANVDVSKAFSDANLSFRLDTDNGQTVMLLPTQKTRSALPDIYLNLFSLY